MPNCKTYAAVFVMLASVPFTNLKRNFQRGKFYIL